MDSAPAIKRRKISRDDGSTGAGKSSTPIKDSNKRTPQSQKEKAPDPSRSHLSAPKPAATTQQAWRQAKASAQQAQKKGKAGRPDVYDDVEGAHGKKPATVRKAQSGGKTKSQLDPLRNQKTERTPATSSKAASTLGFFKQFHTPKKAATAGEVCATGLSRQLVNSTREDGSYGSDDIEEGGVAEVADTVVRKEESITNADTHSRGKANNTPTMSSGGTQNGVKPRHGTWQDGTKKTFEDEIRELEAAAREHAAQDEEGPSVLPTSKRKRTPRKEFDEISKSTTTAKSSPKVNSVRPIARRKVNRTDHAEVVKLPATEDEDATVVENVEIEQEPPVELSLTRNAAPAKPTELSANRVCQRQVTKQWPKQEYLFDPKDMHTIQMMLLQRAARKSPMPLVNLDREHSKVSALISQTVTAGESNSMLLIGARGSGKTALVEEVLRAQQRAHADDFLVVRLNGFIHTDDKITLREIWRQLGREMEPDEADSAVRNYADTLTKLLALLSHSAELGQEQADRVTKSVIFILDEFELFTNHPRQTLLYNLFDIAQSRKAPIAVLGLTTRIDVAESLEKRVKSRFSHRYVHLGLAKSFSAYQDMCRSALYFNRDELSLAEEKPVVDFGTPSQLDLHSSKSIKPESVSAWNAMVDSLFASDTMNRHLQRLYYTTKSVPDFLTSVFMPLATIPTNTAVSNAALIVHFASSLSSSSLRGPDSKLDLLSSLSTLQLALLICAARLNAIHNSETSSFALVYEEYKVLASKAKLQASASGVLAQGAGARVSGKDVAQNAWQDLLKCGLVLDDGRGGGRVDIGLEEIGMSGVELGQWGRWCKEI